MIVLTRHAQASHNIDDIFAGNQLDTEITLQGKNEAEKLAKEIADKYDIDVIICSLLQRTHQTAIIFKKALEIKYKKTVLIIKTGFLNEVDVGVITGMTPQEAEKMFPEEYKNVSSNNIDDWRFTGGETPSRLQKRYWQLVKFLADYKDQNVLLVGHAMYNQIILKNVLEMGNFVFGHNSWVELTNFGEKL